MKDDTISRRAALKGLEDLNIASWYELNEHSQEAYHEIKQMLETLPTVDAVPVVRCKDCKHHYYDRSNIPYCSEGDYAYGWKDDDFCSYGERKDGDGNG